MANVSKAKLAAGLISAVAVCGGTLFGGGCNVFVDVPGALVDVTEDGVFVNFPGGSVEVTDDQVLVDFPGGQVDVHAD